ncbi:endo-1,4-beta-xylanase [Legionella antarctica]|uniref:Endo-1,4-beta-xylanase n=1 Tax=Legionella antarctica TaxID=2708020 RepID=A0A6F8T7M7_9GAMM|nr:endo-1,4-beta-xylanase [Legionella antarctica]
MQYPSKSSLKICFSLGLLLNVAFAQAITPVAVKKETADYIVDIKYPQGFQSGVVNSTIKHLIEKTQQEFIKELAEDADTPADAPGKTGLNITYTVPYKSKHALSVRFNVSIYHRGAAHPSNTVVVENFVAGHPVKLADLFVSGADYLTPIAAFCNNAITAKKISDEKWIREGTKSVEDNYQVWSFTGEGIAIIFNSYQVAAYVYGEQTVAIPRAKIASIMKPELAKIVWSH